MKKVIYINYPMNHNKDKKVLIITSTFPRWQNDNEQKIVLDISNNIKKYSPDIGIFVLAPHFKGAKRQETINQLKIFRFKYFFTRYEKLCYQGGIMINLKKNPLLYLLLPFFFIAQIYSLNKIIKAEKINIIHAHWLIPQGISAIIYKKIFNNKIKIICTLHGSDLTCFQGYLAKLIKNYILKNIDKITTVSQYLKDYLQTSYPDIDNNEIAVVHNGIEARDKKNETQIRDIKNKYKIKSNCLLFVGRLIKIKGVKYLIQAIPMIIKDFPEIKLLIIGNGPEENNLKKLTQELNLNKNIVFLGIIPHDDIHLYYKSADIFIGPSITSNKSGVEGFGIVFLEALSYKLPVIACDTGGIKEIIKDKETGILIKEKEPDQISQAVILLLKDNGLREKLKTNGYQYVKENFNWQNIAKKYVDLYNNF